MQTTPLPISIIAGLGNPGQEYERTRHNAGFWLLDALAQQAGGQWQFDKNYNALMCKINLAGQNLWLMKPHTFMNRSGQAVVPFMRFYRLHPESLLVVHDELDVLPGEVRLKQGGGNGGHNGLKDIQAQLGTPNYWRLRIGIGHPRSLHLQQEVIHFVLGRAPAQQQAAIDESLSVCLRTLPNIVTGQKTAFEEAVRTLHSLKGMSVMPPPSATAVSTA
jgi:peptidyl-tRNA hydrolase, PTH1 family